MNLIYPALLFVIGGILLAIGINTTESIHDEVSRVVIARYNDRTIWYIIGGSLSIVLGLAWIVRGRRT